jgi:hypothetical protein
LTALATRAALRARPYTCQTPDQKRGIKLLVKDTGGLIQSNFVAVWIGPKALDFYERHAADLVAGRCLDLQITRLRAVDCALNADVQLCQLAPLAPSWQCPNNQPNMINKNSRNLSAPTINGLAGFADNGAVVHHSRQPTILRAYTNSTYTKAQALALPQEHRLLDRINQGAYARGEGDNFKGRPVGWGAAGDQMLFEPAFGIPWRLACLGDDIFEGLEPKAAADFAVDFFAAIAPGADLHSVFDGWCAWMLGDAEHGLVAISNKPRVKAMAELFAQAAAGDEPALAQWHAVARDARDARGARATSDAWAARAARAAWDARDAWDARAAGHAWAARAARGARAAWDDRDARAAWAAGAAWSAWSAWSTRAAITAAHQRDALLRLLSLAKGTASNPI